MVERGDFQQQGRVGVSRDRIRVPVLRVASGRVSGPRCRDPRAGGGDRVGGEGRVGPVGRTRVDRGRRIFISRRDLRRDGRRVQSPAVVNFNLTERVRKMWYEKIKIEAVKTVIIFVLAVLCSVFATKYYTGNAVLQVASANIQMSDTVQKLARRIDATEKTLMQLPWNEESVRAWNALGYDKVVFKPAVTAPAQAAAPAQPKPEVKK